MADSMTPPMNPHQKPQEDVGGQAMAESVGLLWAMLPEQHDMVCGHGMPEGCRQYWRDLAAIGLAAGYEAGRRDMREGWVLVPSEPTEAMLKAGVYTDAFACILPDTEARKEIAAIWKGMLSALPTEPLGGEG